MSNLPDIIGISDPYAIKKNEDLFLRNESDAFELQYSHYETVPETETLPAGSVDFPVIVPLAALAPESAEDVGGYAAPVYLNSSLSVHPGNSQGISWAPVRNAEKYTVEYSRDNFSNVLRFEAKTNAVDTYAMPAGTYQWRVKADDGSFVNGNAVQAGKPAAAQKYTSDADGDLDIFFGNADGVWEDGYAAEHQGVCNGWAGTGQQVVLAGKNRITDVFAGSADANILVLTDDANGDALFLEDIYSSSGKEAARLSQINEIRAGAGDDIIDLTSQRFTWAGDGVTIYGGIGDDTIWANCGTNTLSGDDGSDSIAGGSGDDVIIGGAGNDTLHGGGGKDVFRFSGNWGEDTVEQLSGGSVTLWIEGGSASRWDASARTYTDGASRITVSGVVHVSFKFDKADDQPGLDIGNGDMME